MRRALVRWGFIVLLSSKKWLYRARGWSLPSFFPLYSSTCLSTSPALSFFAFHSFSLPPLAQGSYFFGILCTWFNESGWSMHLQGCLFITSRIFGGQNVGWACPLSVWPLTFYHTPSIGLAVQLMTTGGRLSVCEWLWRWTCSTHTGSGLCGGCGRMSSTCLLVLCWH